MRSGLWLGIGPGELELMPAKSGEPIKVVKVTAPWFEVEFDVDALDIVQAVKIDARKLVGWNIALIVNLLRTAVGYVPFLNAAVHVTEVDLRRSRPDPE